MSSEDKLTKFVREWSTRPLPVGIRELADAARERHEGVVAVLFYGSCLRTGRADEGLADLYLLVDDYRRAFGSCFKACLNRLLPPNVFYQKINRQGKVLQSKYAVLTLEDFCKGTRRWFHSYIWGRFAQPAGLIYARDSETAARIHDAQAGAVHTFVRHALPQTPATFTARELWTTGLGLTYRCELRSEGPATAARLVDAAPDYYAAITHAALERFDAALLSASRSEAFRYRHVIPAMRRMRNLLAWRVRQVQGKVLSVLRLLKGLLTFENGLDYILWKIERHSGIRMEVSPALRRFPLLAVPVTFWKLFRKGGFR
jgi:hypothetical protein